MTGRFVPGDVIAGEGTVTLNEGRETVEVLVGNAGDRPVQVGSHYHFFEVNAALEFDREVAFGMRLNVPAGTAVRFEPGDEKSVELVALGGKRRAFGMNGLVDGSVDVDPSPAVERARAARFGDTGGEPDDNGGPDETTTDEDR
jgi:urease subunit beta